MPPARGARPLIAVTTSEVRRAETIQQIPQGEVPARFEMALGLAYMRAVEAAGGIPLVIPPLAVETIEPLLDRVDGICLSGGPDLDPATYGADPHPQLGPTEPPLDRFELAVARAADARQVPVLAICRGTQALNVARGGTLHQHLPDLSEQIGHRQQDAANEPSHAIEVEPGSRLGAALGADGTPVAGQLGVNSFHHQAIDRLGEGLAIVARAPDGTIEAVEDPERDFLIGVQWHAETMVERPYEAALFRSFVDACRGGVSRPEAAARTG
ncbi:MAG TPA: gamma-glutamyl-gamma-aminobutyrate hydrolase family protein [Solirubrobacterales bacterium]|nr:gamma-glutamyl-gamma-aminobutyrate hydrolase family protein [Solirubrobacterales bacterium]